MGTFGGALHGTLKPASITSSLLSHIVVIVLVVIVSASSQPHNGNIASATCSDRVTSPFTCQDVPNICHDVYGTFICPKTCSSCAPHAPPNPCADLPAVASQCADLAASGMCSDPYYARALCPQTCGVCNATKPTTTKPVDPCHDDIGNGLTCSQVPNVCKDIYGRILCKRLCQQCQPTPGSVLPPTSKPLPPGTCVDHVVSEQVTCARLPNVCTDSLAGVFCPKHCGKCKEPCVDHLLGNVKCSMIPGVCRSDIGKLGCPHYCHICNGTGPSPPPAPTTGDMIGNGLSCKDIPGVCQDPIGSGLFCKDFCSHVAPATTTPAPGGQCEDRLGSGLQCSDLKDVCLKTYGKVLCRKHCGACGSASSTAATTPVPAVADCRDRVQSRQCQQLQKDNADFCKGEVGRFLCSLSCRLCTVPTTTATTTLPTTPSTPASTPTMTTVAGTTGFSGPCVDEPFAGNIQCSQFHTLYGIDPCTTDAGRDSCPVYCQLCTPTTSQLPTTTMATTNVPTSPSSAPTTSQNATPGCDSREGDVNCTDAADMDVCNVHGFCDDAYAKIVCRKTCEFCKAGCYDHLVAPLTDCANLYGPGNPIGSKKELCDDALGQKVCQRTCGCVNFCPAAVTTKP